MASGSVGGLVSGLDTNTIIMQLMQAERAPIRQLEARKQLYDGRISAWTDVDTKYGKLATALLELSKRSRLNAYTATSSDETIVTATASSSATPGPVTFRVNSLAAAHQLSSADGFASTDTVVGQGTATIAGGLAEVGATAAQATSDFTAGKHTVTVTDNGGTWEASLDGGTAVAFTPSSTVTLNGDSGSIDVTFGASPVEGEFDVIVAHTDSADSTLTNLAQKINGAGGVAGAQVVDLGSGTDPVKLILTAKETGTENELTVDFQNFTGFGSGFNELRAAGDAEIVIGEGANQLTVTRSSNTVTDVIEGVTLNLLKADAATDVTVTVDVDEESVTAKVQSAVDALNDAIRSLQKHTKYNGEDKAPGALMGDGTARALLSRLRVAMGTDLGSGTYQVLSQLGITANTDGTYELDAAELEEAFEDDFDAAADALISLFEPLDDEVDAADGVDGRIADAKKGAETQSDRFKDRIDDYEVRMALREANYRRQFANLEVMLSQMQAQSQWLSAQVAGMQ